MCAGVGKSGSPAPKPITGSPAAFSALALASTASVADSAMAARRGGDAWTMDFAPSETGAIVADGDGAAIPPTPHHPRSRSPPTCCPPTGGFGCGPSKVRPEAVEALAAGAADYLGTSHRQARVRFEVGRLRNGLAELFALPDGYEVLLGNGGTTSFWDAASFGLIERRSQHLAFGEFSSKFAEVSGGGAAPRRAVVIPKPTRAPTRCRSPRRASTPTASPTTRPRPGWPCRSAGPRAPTPTGAGAGRRHVGGRRPAVRPGRGRRLLLRPAEVPRLRRRPVAGRRVAGGDRADRADRGVGALGAGVARPRDRPRQLASDQTYNTPALATIFLAVQQVEWINNGGLEWAARRCDQSAEIDLRLGRGPRARHAVRHRPGPAQPRGRHHRPRRPVDATVVSTVLRANGIVDTESYRKLGRNQLRVALFPAIEPDDVEQLTRCIDHVVTHLTARPQPRRNWVLGAPAASPPGRP